MRRFWHSLLNAGCDVSQASAWELRRYRYTNLVLLLFTLVAPTFVIAYALMSLPRAPVAITVCFAISISAGWLVRNTKHIDVAGELTASASYIAIVVSLFDLGGMYTSAYCWFLVPPMIGGLLVGYRSCLVWSTVMGLTTFAFAFLHHFDLVPQPLPEPLFFYQSLLTAGGAIAFCATLCGGFISQARLAEEMATRTISKLDAEVRVRRVAEEKARDALQAQSRFLALMSHEIRTPLNGMLGLTRLLKDTPLDSKQSDMLSGSLGAGETLLAVLNDVLDFSKLDAGRMTVERIPLPLHKLVNDLVALHNVAAEDKGLTLELDSNDSLPRWIQGDPTRLRQVLGNLISNAIKFTESGHVVVRSYRADDRLIISVKDSGIGIEKDAIDSLCDAFVQAESSTSRRFGGTGLGLSIAKKLVELMDGHLHIESEIGVGSTFSVSLPLVPVSAPPSQTRNTDQTVRRPLRLLVAEDNAVNQKVIRGFLEREGHYVRLVDTGSDAVRAASNNWDAILMDVQMPEMDGLEATQRIREIHGHGLPIIALTANAMAEDRRRCKDAGMSDFVGKPFNFEEVRTMLDRWTADRSDSKSHKGPLKTRDGTQHETLRAAAANEPSRDNPP